VNHACSLQVRSYSEPDRKPLRDTVIRASRAYPRDPRSDQGMVRAGISLPALMQLMGHADIETTLHYVKVSPQDVYLQYARAAAQCVHPQPGIS
jgi:hypothetical protein